MILLYFVAGLFAVDMAGMVLWYACCHPRSHWLGHPLVALSGSRTVALTFDDGPSEHTPAVLEILRARGVRATFFLCGRSVEQYPATVQSIVDAGHEIGNHSYSHPYLYFHSKREIEVEIDRTQEAIEKACGLRPRLFRPPYGARWFGLPAVLRERSLTLVQWSVNGRDWELAAPDIVQGILDHARPGAIVLLHDGWQPVAAIRGIGRKPAEGKSSAAASVAALSAVIDGLAKQDLEFVTIREMLEMRTRTGRA
jgi:peptidoglycan/xylan/chitin deacetylase (PgdA/CDA1 family)